MSYVKKRKVSEWVYSYTILVLDCPGNAADLNTVQQMCGYIMANLEP